jgi:D-3-phosphoglycerate dehydrogenase / 2-oxoglutarate reductase
MKDLGDTGIAKGGGEATSFGLPMKTRILLTTTSYQDTPGPHHALLEGTGYEIVRERGPLPESRMLELAGDFDGFLCGDDMVTRTVLEQSLPRLKVISKYGIGLDKIDVEFATQRRLPVLFTPGVNHSTVAEHTFALLLGLTKKVFVNGLDVRAGAWKAGWKKPVGREIQGKTLGIIGLGRVGREVAIRAKAFGMRAIAYDPYFDSSFAAVHGVTKCLSVDEVLHHSDVISLHCFLDHSTRGMINAARIAEMRDGVVVVNCARGELVVVDDMVAALASGKVGGYGTDVLDEEPPPVDYPLLKAPNCLVTAHIASRTYESVERQALRATHNLINFLIGDPDYVQANSF